MSWGGAEDGECVGVFVGVVGVWCAFGGEFSFCVV